jgi:hypothetical protein
VQINIRVKISIVALLGLGIFASTAAIVRLTVTLNLSATTDFLYCAMPVAAWAHAELGLGVILANLPALRPLVEPLYAAVESAPSIRRLATTTTNSKKARKVVKAKSRELWLRTRAPKQGSMAVTSRTAIQHWTTTGLPNTSYVMSG